MSKYFIELKNIAKAYHRSNNHKIDVLTDFSLSVEQSEVLSIYGPNGCGKSTILGIIAQLITPDKGTVLINGKKPEIGDIGCLFQDYSASLFPWLTCGDNIAFSLKLAGVDKKERRKRVKEVLLELGINIELDKYPYELSGGQQQLVALARALCNSPSALVMDEPFSSLDAAMRENVRAESAHIISSLQLTAVLVSHNLEDCIFFSDRIVFLTTLPARIYKIVEVPLGRDKTKRRIHSDLFADVMSEFGVYSKEAHTL